MQNIYDKYTKDTSNSYVLLDTNISEAVSVQKLVKGRVTFTHKPSRTGIPSNGCYLHFFGLPMVYVSEKGCGYNVADSMFEKCIALAIKNLDSECNNVHIATLTKIYNDIKNGDTWQNALYNNGFFAASLI